MSITELVWNVLVISGCGYAVFYQGHSGWWFLLALILLQGAN